MIKRLLLPFLFLSIFYSSHAQDNKLTLGFGLGASMLFEEIPLLLIDVEATVYLGIFTNGYALYNFNEKFSAGLELNINVPVGMSINNNLIRLFYLNGYLAKLKYKFGGGVNRFFLGFMTGLNRSVYYYNSFGSSGVNKYTDLSFALIAEIGVQFKRFQVFTSFHYTTNDFAYGFEVEYMILQMGVGWNFGVF